MFASITNLLKNLFILVVTHTFALVVGIVIGAIGYVGLSAYFEEEDLKRRYEKTRKSPTEQ